MTAVSNLGISDLQKGYRSGAFTPVEVANSCIAAYQQLNPRYQAWVCFDEDKLLDAAQAVTDGMREGHPARALDGVPVAVKDIFNTVDFPTQMGSPLWKGFTPGNDARAVFNLKRAGAVIPGKTNTAEFAVHTLGETVNPHAAQLTPGTSSSGSAVAVATGMVPVALGTQTAGSIVRPASFCGVWGCKPSFGLIPRTGMLKTTDSLDSVGYFVSHAQDLAVVLDALQVHGRNFPISHAALNDVARQSKPTGRPWRIAVVRPAHVWGYVPDYASHALTQWCDKLAGDSQFEVVEQTLASELARSHTVHETIYNRALAYYFKEEFKRAELISPVMNRLIEAGQQIDNTRYEAALDEQVALARQMDAFFEGCDAIVTLSTAGQAPPREQEEAPDSALIWTLTHLAVVGAPAFVSPQGLPFGLQVVARRYNDPLLFRLVADLVSAGHLPNQAFPALAVHAGVASLGAAGGSAALGAAN
jgi:Asp-tRNA(Asn)/Glu-tRNA(Gln) amidotransferase A subunit family amidase